MAEEFLDEADRHLAELRAAVDHQDAETVQTVAHRLKNSVIFLGASAAEEATERVDRLGRRGDLAEAPAAIERLGTQIEKLKQALRAHLADSNGHDH
jgi:HPt (histidine-containing phosphotransfer) domain-containing protein